MNYSNACDFLPLNPNQKKSKMSIFRKAPKSPFVFSSTIVRRFLTTDTPKPATSAAYDDLIDAAGRQRDFATVHGLLSQRYENGCFNTNRTFNFISIDLSVLDDLLKILASLDAGYTRKGAYDSLIAHLSKMQRPDLALRVADEMIRGGHGANAITFHPILKFFAKKRMFKEEWRVMDVMKESEIAPDTSSYVFILSAYCMARDLLAAAGVLRRMAEEGVEADGKIYDAMVAGACGVGKVDGALVMLRKMLDGGVPVSYSTYAHIIGSLLRLGYHAQAVEFVMCFGGRDKGVDTENFGLLARRLVDMEKMVDAKFVLGEMVKMDLPMGEKLIEFLKSNSK